MGNNVAAGHMMQMTGLPQAAGFHKTLGHMMDQYGIRPWDPKVLLQENLQRQQELQRSSPFRFIPVKAGLCFYASQIGVLSQLTREKFVQVSMQLFNQKGLHLPMEETRLFYDIFDSIDLYRNATLSVGELAGGLSSFFGGSVEDKTNAVFELVAQGQDRMAKTGLQDILKPYVWCMVPEEAQVLRPILLPHVTDEIYNDMTYANTGYISRQELQRWCQKGQFSQGQHDPNKAQMAITIVDRAALAISMALHVAWKEYEEKYQLREYGQQTWTQNYGNRPQQLTDVGAYRYVRQQQPAIAQNTASAFTNVQQGVTQVVNGANAWFTNYFGDSEAAVSPRGRVYTSESISSRGGGGRRFSSDNIAGTVKISPRPTTQVPSAAPSVPSVPSMMAPVSSIPSFNMVPAGYPGYAGSPRGALPSSFGAPPAQNLFNIPPLYPPTGFNTGLPVRR